jgi:class 3 adenylate cyclase
VVSGRETGAAGDTARRGGHFADDVRDRGFSVWTLGFRDRRLERAYIAVHNRSMARPIRWMLAIFVVIVVAGALGDWITGEPTFAAMLGWRAALLALAALGFALTFSPWVIRRGQPVSLAFGVALHAALIVMTPVWGGAMLWAQGVYLLALAFTLIVSGMVFRLSAPLSGAAAAAYAAVIAAWTPSPFSPVFFMLSGFVVLGYSAYVTERARRAAWAAARALAREKARSEELLLNVLPPAIAARMRAGETLIADRHAQAAVLFADIAGFTQMSAAMPPERLVRLLDRIFTAFDAIADRRDLEKIKTIGDAYMLAAGAPEGRPPDAGRVCDAALEMLAALERIAVETDAPLSMRAGVHVGPLVAGVIGRRKFIYDLWGDTVNVASRMESTAPVGRVQVTEDVRQLLADSHAFEARGTIAVKGKGSMATHLLVARRGPQDRGAGR